MNYTNEKKKLQNQKHWIRKCYNPFELSQFNGYQQIIIYSRAQLLHLLFDTFLKPLIKKKKINIPPHHKHFELEYYWLTDAMFSPSDSVVLVACFWWNRPLEITLVQPRQVLLVANAAVHRTPDLGGRGGVSTMQRQTKWELVRKLSFHSIILVIHKKY